MLTMITTVSLTWTRGVRISTLTETESLTESMTIPTETGVLTYLKQVLRTETKTV